MLSEATSEMSPLPKFEVMGREVRAKGVLSGSNYQWFNRLIKDDEPYRWKGLSVELRRSASAPRFPSGLGETAPALAG